MATRMQQRRGTAAQWTATNPVLADGEIGYETDTGVIKIGNGVTNWTTLTSAYLLKTAKAADSELLDGLNSTAFMLATAKKTVRIPHTFTISGEVKVAVGDTSYIPPFFVPEPAGQIVTVAAARHRINSGTSATVKLQNTGVDVTGWTGLSVTPTSTTSTPGVGTVTNGDALALVVTAVSGTPKNLSFTVYLDYEV